MSERRYLDALLRLPEIGDPAERNATWRQSLATLAGAVADHQRSLPLEGLDPDILERAMLVAIEDGLVDDVAWLSGPAAAAALYELAAAIPTGEAKRQLGRRLLEYLRRGDAATFVSLATQLASGSRRALHGPSVRARVALALDLPIGLGARVDGLALALISRRETSRDWLTRPSTGSLPSRRLAARLLERAAREAAHRALEGDDSGVRVFETPEVQDAWTRLLAERESLVWRHVASARGLLSSARPKLRDEIQEHLETKLGVTQWRRAAASLAASIAHDPKAEKACYRLLGSEIFKQDAGIATAMIFGLPRAAEREPAVVEKLLEQLVRVGGISAAEALVDLRRERIAPSFGEWAAERARAQLRETLSEVRNKDDGEAALAQALIDELDVEAEHDSLRDMVAKALDAFVRDGAKGAQAAADLALRAAEQRVAFLEQCVADAEGTERRMSFRALRELDLAILESDSLANLLALRAKGEELGSSVQPLGDLFQRLANWLIIREGDPVDRTPEHFTLRMRRLRALLHLVDADGTRVDGREELRKRRRLVAARVLLNRMRHDGNNRQRRAMIAATARTCDALIREETCEVSDIFLLASTHAKSKADIVAMAEAAMVPELVTALTAYAKLQERMEKAPRARQSVRALMECANALPAASSSRVEALRRALLDLARSLEPLALSQSQLEIAERSAGESPLAMVEAAIEQFSRLVVGAYRRAGVSYPEDRSATSAIRLLDIHLERTIRGKSVDLSETFSTLRETLKEEVPPAILDSITCVLARVPKLPVDAPRNDSVILLTSPKEAPLPGWVPSNRVLGGFYVKRSIGTGAVGSVFVAARSEERKDPKAEQFALKTPEFSGGAARTLTEEEFLQMFREEAGALLSLPQHKNIARFVTFDAGARPKPILVMELVEGPNLERLMEMKDLDMTRAVELLVGLADGLDVMHSKGIAHLDIKPSNVIVREGDVPVLVDFGLAGRTLRPGCGTASYGAPEVWGHSEVDDPEATAADVYAFGCLAFELLTGKPLFEGPHDLATITQHLQHDGMPKPVGQMSTDPRTAGIAEIIRRSIRRNPAERVKMRDIRVALERLRPTLTALSWPIQGTAR